MFSDLLSIHIIIMERIILSMYTRVWNAIGSLYRRWVLKRKLQQRYLALSFISNHEQYNFAQLELRKCRYTCIDMVIRLYYTFNWNDHLRHSSQNQGNWGFLEVTFTLFAVLQWRRQGVRGRGECPPKTFSTAVLHLPHIRWLSKCQYSHWLNSL